MLRRAKSTLVLQESTSLFIKKDSIITSQESNNIIALKPTFKLGGGALKTSSKMSNSIFSSSSAYSPESSFLIACSLCRKKLSPLKSIFMYGGDQGFCSESCRCRKILIEEMLMEEVDEEEETTEIPTHFATSIGNGLPPRRNHVRASA